MTMLDDNDFIDTHRILKGSFSNYQNPCLRMYSLSIVQLLNWRGNFGVCRNDIMLQSHWWRQNLTMDIFWTIHAGKIVFGHLTLRDSQSSCGWYGSLESTFLFGFQEFSQFHLQAPLFKDCCIRVQTCFKLNGKNKQFLLITSIYLVEKLKRLKKCTHRKPEIHIEILKSIWISGYLSKKIFLS